MQHLPDGAVGQRHVETQGSRATQREASHPLDRWQTYPRLRGALGVFTGILVLAGLTFFIFSSAGQGSRNPSGSALQTPAGSTGARAPTAATAASSAGATVVTARVRQYSLRDANLGVMQPVVGKEGNIWFGEMFANALASLNPKTGSTSTWTPPHGEDNIMETAIDQHGDVWFTEQAANYIGRFDPASQEFTIFPLNQRDGHSSAPQDLKFDGAGNLWFTEVSAGRIGRLDPATKKIVTWPVPSPASGTQPFPFCLAVTPSGQIWFGYLSGGAVGRLDPAAGAVRVYHLSSSQTEVYSMEMDQWGTIWFSELAGGKLGRVDPTAGRVDEIPVPNSSAGPASGMYALQVAKNGDVWLAVAAANSLVRYHPHTGAFTYFQLSTPGSVPFGLAFDATDNLWFTAAGTPNYVGVLSLS